MTDYKKWNSMKMSDLGWTAEDERHSSVTPAMQAFLDAKANEEVIKEAKKSLEMAQRDQVRLRKTLEDINQRKKEVEKNTNFLLFIVFLTAAAIIFAISRVF